jgi:hypothetical protein
MSIEVLIKVEHLCRFSPINLVGISLLLLFFFFRKTLSAMIHLLSDEVFESAVHPRARAAPDRNLFQENRIEEKKLLEFFFRLFICYNWHCTSFAFLLKLFFERRLEMCVL